ncbi:MAG: aldehyde dehydrogenase family protein, partial [Desulfobulbia bacterium]
MNSLQLNNRFDLDSMRMLINGDLVASESGRSFDSINPTNGNVITAVPEATRADVTKAIDAAENAQPEWAGLPVAERSRYMRELAEQIAKYGEELLRVEVLDTGNIISEMRRDVQASVNQLNYYAGLGYELKGNTIPATPYNLHITIRQPYGIVGRIIPFNHPLMFAAAKMGAPLIAGNTMIIKPSEQSPLSACCLAELCAEFLPPGVVNFVTGFGDEAGDAIVCDPRVKRIAFIGSVETGMMIQRRAAEHAVKNVSLELGGKNPMIIFPDADFDKAVVGAIKG